MILIAGKMKCIAGKMILIAGNEAYIAGNRFHIASKRFYFAGKMPRIASNIKCIASKISLFAGNRVADASTTETTAMPIIAASPSKYSDSAMGHALRALAAFLFLGTLLAQGEDRKPESSTKPVNPLLGRWEAVSIGEKPMPREFAMFWVIDEQSVTVTDRAGEQISKRTYTFDNTKEPPEMAMKVDGEKDRIGWFRFKEKDLQLLLTINTGEPPKSWDDGDVLVLRPAPK